MKKYRAGLAVFVILFTLLIIGKNSNISAQTAQRKSAAKTVLIFEKKPCFGFCPVYKAEFLSDGNIMVTYQQAGKELQKTTFRIARQETQELIKRGENLGFFKLKDKYETLITDYQVREITLFKNGKSKKVSYTEGGPAGLDSYLNDIAELVEKNLNVNFGPPEE